MSITIKEVSIEEIVAVNAAIVEFGEPCTRDYFESRYQSNDKLMIVAYLDDMPAWYIVGYDKYNDNSFYCWMAGVDPKYRRKWVLKELMSYQENWAKNRDYKRIKITTRNTRRNMLAYLIKYGFFLTEVNQYPDVENNRIHLEKIL